ncbi:MAG: hypothetical protein UW22_C0003G0018 [Candidatus Gottesmanbacteria bacterium GW2011_GWB1_44_11c]|uniref:Membrane protein 6-pyruvoyl-tetrahydropterin synthase-related domain-containing protein n=1 Tax=Candidatus Gottesmanbacteria bacterium GW2011_GWB1_44_11c TaxID=1618447 RepID=A0A0G1GV47_9BACT|nr:MAG: hypothetical protein UW22_C0003G0018 [Candidatus Gottesmanbacteria bacterium GW2011_GWB1_44_11c]
MGAWYFASGDLDFFWPEQIQALSWFPNLWRTDIGLGKSVIQSLWLDYPFRLFLKALFSLGISWFFIEKILWLGVLSLGIYASYRLAKYLFSRARCFLLTPILYIGNTYALLLFGGGQLGVAFAYSVSPLVLLTFIQYIDNYNDVRSLIKNGLWFALLICFDIRLAFLILCTAVFYFLMKMFTYRRAFPRFWIRLTRIFFIPLVVAASIHPYWILPTVIQLQSISQIGEQFTNSGMLRFLSVADFSHAISLLHPNWPENLFGKVYFLHPEFLVLPIVAFSSLLFIDKTHRTNTMNKTKIFFFALLALFGAFFAKGVQEPFGGLYLWLFTHVPGFVMFRDPTKFYLLIALSFSVLIPYSLTKIYDVVYSRCQTSKTYYSKRIGTIVTVILYTSFFIFWSGTMRQIFVGGLSGNFKPQQVPNEYVRLKNMLVSDAQSSRTLWLPTMEKFAYYSTLHPYVTKDTIFPGLSDTNLLDFVSSQSFYDALSDYGVRYVIVPIDTEKRIFLSDYTFDPLIRERLISALSQTRLQKIPEYSDIAVFENSFFMFHLEIPSYVGQQEYWSKIGVILSIACGIICMIFLFFNRENYGK